MQMHQAEHEGRVELNIGGFRFETSVRTLHCISHTFFDAYFSGRYAQDVCADGSIFVDRDGAHFGHVLEYMRDGVVSVAEPGSRPSTTLLRALKREFGYYCIELCTEQPTEPHEPEVALVMGGHHAGTYNAALASMERYDLSSGQWSIASAMSTVRYAFGACVLAGELYVSGGIGTGQPGSLSSVEKYTPSSDTWTAVTPLSSAREEHAVVAVGSAMYVLGGVCGGSTIPSVLKFDSTHSTWSVVELMPEARQGHAACAIVKNICVFGGHFRLIEKTSVFKFDTEINKWSTLQPMPFTCSYHSVSVLDGGAGEDNEGIICFDTASGLWSTLGATSNSKQCTGVHPFCSADVSMWQVGTVVRRRV
jgi:hypothetical protein